MTTQSLIFGYHLDQTINEHEAAIVRMIFFMYVVCELSHQQIAFHLNRLGIACPAESWTDMLVYETLTNPAYIGRGPGPDIRHYQGSCAFSMVICWRNRRLYNPQQMTIT